jgi:diguanylate cyclase (GGDEF)-like protein/PAS domain S-box-containing protein
MTPAPTLTWQSLAAYDWLHTPMWVFDLGQMRMAWANRAGLALWQAASIEELRGRDCSDTSPAMRTRLAALMETIERDGPVTLNWTIFPRGTALQVRMTRTAIRLEDGRLGILAQAEPLLGEGVPAEIRRDLDALSRSSAQISVHRDDGAALMRNPAAVEAFGPPAAQPGGDDFAAQVGEAAGEVRAGLAQGQLAHRRVRVHTRHGARWHQISACTARDPVTGGRVLLLDAQDVTEAVAAEERARIEKQLLEMISTGERLPRVLEALVRGIEALSPGVLCSVLLLDAGGRLRTGPAPSLPADYTASLDGLAIGPHAGSCGSAAWSGDRVIATDIASDARWADHREQALAHGLRACWSLCIKAADGAALGTFAAYSREPRAPQPEELQLMEAACRIAGIAIERVRAQEALEGRERELRAVMDSVPAMICYADTQQHLVYANQRYADWVGWKREALLGRHVREIVGDETYALMEPHLRQVLAGREVRYERRERRRGGGVHDFEVHYVPNFDAQGTVCGYFVLLTDVTERKRDEEMLYFLANHDQLTRLPNRNLFNEHLQLAVAQAARNQEKLATLFIDLDRFKKVNDTLGHETGDRLLKQVADRFRSCLRESDLVARLGGDEYTVLMRPVREAQEAASLAQKLINVLAQPLEIDGHELYVTCSVGISLFPDDGRDAASLLKDADIAMYRAKDQGKNNYQFFSSEVNAASFEHLMLETSLRRALEREEFVLEFQPIVDLRSRRTTGMEALVRWRHPDLGLVSPAKFIPLAEETGLIVPLGRWVLEQACRNAVALQREGAAGLHVAVNLSARQFRQKELARSVGECLARTGLDPRSLELEVTESSVMEGADEAIRTLHELKAMGIHLSIDDFGTGYSSLAYLKRFPIDALKIDQSFVRDITTDQDDAAIASAIIAMGHSLRLTLIAEGVESEEQLAFLRERDCHKVQGYLFGRPMPAEQLGALLAQRGRAAA